MLHDQETYGSGRAQVFRETAEANGIEILAFEGIDPKAGSYASIMQKVVDAGADMVYFGGLVDTGAPQLIKDLRDIEEDPEAIKFLSGDGIVESSLVDGAGEAAAGTYGTVAFGPPSEFTGAAKEFYDAYKAQYNTEPEPYAIFGYDSMGVALTAIDRACSKDPKAILDALNNLGSYDGALGSFSFDENGDTTLETYHGWQVKDGRWQWVEELSAEAPQG
ncbi:MAG: branched-chain amino acid ABC transporter substrate-binding protein [Chloroflexia bacterium]